MGINITLSQKNKVTTQYKYAFTADSVRECSIYKQK